IIVVDPRETESAKLATLWLQLRPGTDAALLMSMINVIIAEGLYDKDFVEKWCYGFDRLAERAREYHPDKVADITWVPADKIKKAARIIGENKPIYSANGMGTEHLQGSIQAIQARLILVALTGSVDVDGGMYMPGPGISSAIDWEAGNKLTEEQKLKQLGAGRFPFISWPGYKLIEENTMRLFGVPPASPVITANAHAPTMFRAILTGDPYPVKAVITNFSNPMVTSANTKLVYNALLNLDLYVVTDYWLTPSAELADYVLPVASWLERPFLVGYGSEQGLFPMNYGGEQGLPSSIPGEYDHKTDYEIFRELGLRLGQKQDWPWKNLEEVYDAQLAPVGTTFKEFMDKNNGLSLTPREYLKYKEIGFATTSGKVELYSTILEKLGYDPLPNYEEPFETPISRPDLVEKFPFMLITGGRFREMFHSEHRQIDPVRRKRPHPLVQINPDTAKSLGIGNGDWVWIESPRGRIRMKCQYYTGIDSRVIHCEHGWWFPELPGEEPWLHGVWESNVNVLTDDDPDHCNKISGGWPLKTALCNIYKCKAY
ncbi:molybdopterin-dependent oxidoreductase, partial [Chloroflexota bacterium]